MLPLLIQCYLYNQAALQYNRLSSAAIVVSTRLQIVQRFDPAILNGIPLVPAWRIPRISLLKIKIQMKIISVDWADMLRNLKLYLLLTKKVFFVGGKKQHRISVNPKLHVKQLHKGN